MKHSNLPTEGVKELSVTQPSLEVTTDPIAFNTIRRENSLLPKGKEKVVSEGKDGQVTTYVEVDGSVRKVVKVEREELKTASLKSVLKKELLCRQKRYESGL